MFKLMVSTQLNKVEHTDKLGPRVHSRVANRNLAVLRMASHIRLREAMQMK